MVAQLGYAMAAKGDASPDDGGGFGGKNVRGVRVKNDLADMLGEISDVRGENVAAILDRLLRAPVTAMHERYKAAIQAQKKADAIKKKVREETPD